MTDELHQDASPRPQAGQEKIWAHFHTAGANAFAAAEPRLEFLVRQIARRAGKKRPAVLNVGVGSGHFERIALGREWDVHALDPDAAAIERLAALGVQGHVGYIEQMPLANEAFDFVVASEVLEHLTDAQRSAGIAEIGRVLRPQGWFLGTVPYHENLQANEVLCPCCGALFHRWGHHKSFELDTLRAELTPHFDVREIRATAFVSYREGGLGRKLKSLLRVALARSGQMIASPNIYWAAQRR